MSWVVDMLDDMTNECEDDDEPGRVTSVAAGDGKIVGLDVELN